LTSGTKKDFTKHCQNKHNNDNFQNKHNNDNFQNKHNNDNFQNKHKKYRPFGYAPKLRFVSAVKRFEKKPSWRKVVRD